MVEIDWTTLIVAFGGGILGAAFGGLNAFILCGLASIVGTIMTMVSGDVTFNRMVTWGPFLGPHVAFAGGVAASAFAAKKGELCSGRNVLISLFGFNSPMILLVGGIFGVFGYVLNWVLNLIPDIGGIPWTNTIALSIIMSGIVCRLLFGDTGLLGKIPEGRSRWKRSRDEAWQPWPSHPFQVLLIGVAVSLLAATMVVLVPGSMGFFFGLAALSLIFFQFGAKIPVILHIALSAEMVVAATGTVGWGLVFGLLAVFLSEIFACVFLIHGDTHIDPPAMSLVVMFALYPVCVVTGFIEHSGYYFFIPVIFVCFGGYALLAHPGKRSQS
ncbi:MAG: hypothetical protein ABIL68_07780, partial [bacterium]